MANHFSILALMNPMNCMKRQKRYVHVRVIQEAPVSQARMGRMTLTVWFQIATFLLSMSLGRRFLKACPYADGHAGSPGSPWPFPPTLDLLPQVPVQNCFQVSKVLVGVRCLLCILLLIALLQLLWSLEHRVKFVRRVNTAFFIC